MANATPCSADDCERPSVARGLCTKHYSYWYRAKNGRKRDTYAVTCAHCGSDAMVTSPGARYCSLSCVAKDASLKARDRRLPVLHPNPTPMSHLPAKHPARRPAPTRGDWWQLLVYGACERCGDHFMSLAATYENRSLYCSRSCARSQGKDRRRAAKRSGYVAVVHRRKIFERDGWRCQICRRRVLRSKAVPHPRAPTIDHVIPLALGGTHEPANAQLACFECNCLKSHTGVGDQLRLIG